MHHSVFAAGVAVVVVGLAVPYAIAGPGFICDDWIFLRNRMFLGPMAAAGDWQLTVRPGSWLVFNLTFGVLGDHPFAVYAIQVAIVAGIAVMFFACLRPVVGPRHAAAITAIWSVVPTHSAIDHWGSVGPTAASVFLLLVGVRALQRGDRRSATLSLVAATLTYELTLAAAMLAVVAVPGPADRRDAPARIRMLAVLAAVGIAMYVRSPKRDLGAWLPLREVVRWLGDSAGMAAGPIGLVGVIGVVVGVVLVLVRRDPGRTRLVAMGAAVITAGLLPSVRFHVELVGLGDRIAAVATLGVAMIVWAALCELAASRREVAALVATVALVAVVDVRLERDEQYAWAADRVPHVVATAVSAPLDDSRMHVVPGGPVYRDNITAVQGPHDLTPAVQYATGDGWIVARFEADLVPRGVAGRESR